MFTWLKQDKPIFAWMPPIIWASVIFMFAVLPYNEHLSLTVGSFDKMVHFLEYVLLAVLVVRSIRRAGLSVSLKNSLFALILGGGYGIVMELIQLVVPGRDASLPDVACNITGMAIGMILGKLVLWRR